MSSLCIIFPKMKDWFSGLLKCACRSKEVVSLWVLAAIGGFRGGALIRATNKVVFAAFTCSLALGGAMLGAIHGAIKGQTTETGFVYGAGIGGLAGAIAAIQLMDLAADESFSKVALLAAMLNGKVYMEWVSSALLKAYLWQVSTLETTYREISELYDIAGVKGLSHETIQKLPQSTFHSGNMIEYSGNEFCCSICLQELKDGEYARELPMCRHLFHLACIDQWLKQQASCPMCRMQVCSDNA